MATRKTSGNGNKTKTNQGNASSGSSGESGGMQASQLMKLFEDSLKDIYWAEKALTKALPKMIKNATSAELVEALENHLSETETQIERVEEVFEMLEKKPVAKKCEAMQGLIKEGEGIMDECEDGSMMDAGIIGAGQKIEHYEIAAYGTLRTFAETLGLSDVAALLQETLEEEKAADEKLTEVAVSAVNVQAAQEDE
jgi:ferritin-like metal-binding protein YciE